MDRFKTASLAAIIAAATGTAHALNLNPEGEGQVLIFPYYTVNGGQATLISLRNRTPFGKALRVRFHEAQNGRHALEFNLYLAPRDVWTASVYSLYESGPAVLSTDDETCTVPRIKHNAALPQAANGLRYVAFRNYHYAGGFDDAGSNHLDRSRSGHIEVIEMGIVGNGDATSGRRTLDAIGIADDGGPRDCAQVVNAWTQGSRDPYWLQDPVGGIDMLAPTPGNGGGHLSGSVGIVDFSEGTQLSYQADAIEGFSASLLHAESQNLNKPQLSDANWPSADVATAHWVDDGVVQTARYARERAIDAVSALFTHDVIHNEFVSSASLTSEWVLTFPTKRFYADPAHTPIATAPFSQLFQATPSGAGGSRVGFMQEFYDREERSNEPCFIWEMCQAGIPLPPPPMGTGEPMALAEVSVMTFAQRDAFVRETAILAAPNSRDIDLDYGFLAGSAVLRFWVQDSPYPDGISDHAISRPDLDGHRVVGLPVTGFWVEETRTTSVLANFAGLWRHRGTRCRVLRDQDAQAVCRSPERYVPQPIP